MSLSCRVLAFILKKLLVGTANTGTIFRPRSQNFEGRGICTVLMMHTWWLYNSNRNSRQQHITTLVDTKVPSFLSPIKNNKLTHAISKTETIFFLHLIWEKKSPWTCYSVSIFYVKGMYKWMYKWSLITSVERERIWTNGQCLPLAKFNTYGPEIFVQAYL